MADYPERELYRSIEDAMKRAEQEPRRLPRRLFIRASTLAAIGGAFALPELLAACGGSSSSATATATAAATSSGAAATAASGGASATAAATQTAGSTNPAVAGDITAEQYLAPLAKGKYQYSPFPLVEKYNWRFLPWGNNQTRGGNLIGIPYQPPTWDPLHQPVLNSYGGRLWSTLGHEKYGKGVDMDQINMEGDLASSWPPEASPDGSAFTFKLRQGVKFADLAPANGRELTAEDVMKCFQAYKTNSIWQSRVDAITKIETPDKYTVKFTLNGPAAYFPATVSEPDLWIFPPEQLEKADQMAQHPVGTGPFILKEAPPQDHFLMVRNPTYFGKDAQGRQLPYLDSTRQNWITDYSVELAAFRSGQQDFTGPPNLKELHALVSTVPHASVEVTPQDPAVQVATMFQMKNPLFQDIRVRRAFSLALDRQAIIKTTWQGAAVPAEPVPYDYQGLPSPLTLDEQGQWVKYDPTQAKALLKQAGHESINVELVYSSTIPSDYLTAYQQAKGYWQAVGINVNLVSQENTTYLETGANKSFTGLYGVPAVAGYDGDALYQLYHKGSPLNYGSWSDDQTETFFTKERATLDPKARQQVFRDLNTYLFDQVPAVFIGSRHRIEAMQPWSRGMEDDIHSWGGYWGSWQQAKMWLLPSTPGGRGGKPMA